jgi:DNA-binding SARP family transcriptional activator
MHRAFKRKKGITVISGGFNQAHPSRPRPGRARPRLAEPEGAAANRPPNRPIRLTLLGGFAADGRMPQLSAGSPWRIAAYLAIHGPSPRPRVAGLLWPEAGQAKAQASLRSGLWRLQAQLPGLVEVRRDSLDLARGVSSDLEAFLVTVRHVLAAETCDPADCALITGAGELTPEWEDEWIETERERLRQLRLRSLGVLADRLLAARQVELAYQVTLAELATDPLREIAHRRMIRLHLSQGDVAQAQQQFETCAALLRAELGVRPSPRTVNLLEDATTETTVLDESKTVGVL